MCVRPLLPSASVGYIDLFFCVVDVLPRDLSVRRVILQHHVHARARRSRIAPVRTGDRKRVLDTIRRELEVRNVVQGEWRRF